MINHNSKHRTNQPHRVNQDGGGPFECDISTDASGSNFQPMTIVTQVPGIRGFSAATAEDFPLVARMFISLGEKYHTH
jgi:hypothetical protein